MTVAKSTQLRIGGILHEGTLDVWCRKHYLYPHAIFRL